MMVPNDPIISVDERHGRRRRDPARRPHRYRLRLRRGHDLSVGYASRAACRTCSSVHRRLRDHPGGLDQAMCEAVAFLYRERDRIGLSSKVDGRRDHRVSSGTCRRTCAPVQSVRRRGGADMITPLVGDARCSSAPLDGHRDPRRTARAVTRGAIMLTRYVKERSSPARC
jgi:hypothetical protein